MEGKRVLKVGLNSFRSGDVLWAVEQNINYDTSETSMFRFFTVNTELQ